ncbi:MAG: hypothetical protein H7X79_05025 [Sporomusaceae bacterium]|nr:hypothetical protein [Sporomusaceae bacterium]
MSYDWTIWGSILMLGAIAMAIYSARKPQRMFTRKIDHLHVRTIKRF